MRASVLQESQGLWEGSEKASRWMKVALRLGSWGQGVVMEEKVPVSRVAPKR